MEFFTLLVMVLILFITLGLPIWFSLKIPYYLWKKSQIKTGNSIADYWLSEAEKEKFREYDDGWKLYVRKEKDIKSKIEEIHQYAQSINLSPNVDGSYARRTEEGKTVMNQLNKLEKELQEYQDDESYWWDKAWDLSVSPRDRWEEDFNNHKMKDFYRRGILTSISAVILWVSLILAFALPYVSDFVQKVPISIAGNTDGILVVAMGLSSLITLVLLKMIKWYHTRATS